MNEDHVKEELKKYFASNGHHIPSDDEDLFVRGVLDSFGVLELIAFLEEKFHVQLGPADVTIENVANIARISRLVQDRQK